MPLRKAPHADLRRTALLRAQVAALLALALPLAAFTFSAVRPAPASFGVESPVETITVVPPPPTRHEVPKPPPPPRPPLLLEVPDETLIDDAEIVFEDAPVVTAPLPPPLPPVPDEQDEVPSSEPFAFAEEMPALLPSAEEGLRALQQCIRYPEMAKRAGIGGRVFVQFVVDESGRVTAPVVSKGIGGGADEEALRCVREARFTPGRQRGRAVSVQFSLPVTFQLR